ncbi:protein TSSC4 [Hylaeus anthracinus]|uniref:protein TSSC4 n=1 Tax=Hylaeus volcanicus TaxID=313075 RepID=UPI0023B7EAA8|nr:protein TSSC4 [Hylaeus volcanicus]XP_054012379.1 protein TSSC4 [Hylaeus anthracinus]
MHTSGDFKLHGGDSAFANRQKLLFDKLSDAEQECNKNKMTTESTDVDMAIDESNKTKSIRTGLQRKNETKRFRGKESIFKRPEGPAPRAVNRSVPDYHKHPHKWMKYSLDDVSNDDMTEQSNTTAALSFLNELKARRSMEQIEGTEEMDYDEISMIDQSHDQTKVACKSKKVQARKSVEAEEMDVDNTTLDEHNETKTVIKPRKIKATSEIEFKKPESDTEKTENAPIIIDHDDKPTFRSSKVIMPEYIVGQKQKKKKRNKKEKLVEKVDRLKQLKLDHLEELDEEEN